MGLQCHAGMENQHGGACFFWGQILAARFSVRDGDGHQPYSQGFYFSIHKKHIPEKNADAS